jgi:16S rRNA (guanine527-N7)-methyltransferase
MKALEQQLIAGCTELTIKISSKQTRQQLELIDLLLQWNKKINLTSITNPAEAISKHVLDSLSLLPTVHGNSVLDVGTGAGFPGLPLAIMLPDVQFTLLDSNRKKITFIQYIASKLDLKNVQAIHARIQDHRASTPYTSITARAFSDINKLLKWLPQVYDSDTLVLAMKGKMPEKELESLRDSILSSQWTISGIEALKIPGLDADRCVIKLKQNEIEIK